MAQEPKTQRTSNLEPKLKLKTETKGGKAEHLRLSVYNYMVQLSRRKTNK